MSRRPRMKAFDILTCEKSPAFLLLEVVCPYCSKVTRAGGDPEKETFVCTVCNTAFLTPAYYKWLMKDWERCKKRKEQREKWHQQQD